MSNTNRPKPKPLPDHPKALVSQEQVAVYYKISRERQRADRDLGKIDFIQEGPRIYYVQEDIWKYIESRKINTRETP